MVMATRVQILEKTVCISYSPNTHGKGMNPTIPSPGMGKKNRADWALQPWYANWSRKTLNSNLLNSTLN